MYYTKTNTRNVFLNSNRLRPTRRRLYFIYNFIHRRFFDFFFSIAYFRTGVVVFVVSRRLTPIPNVYTIRHSCALFYVRHDWCPAHTTLVLLLLLVLSPQGALIVLALTIEKKNTSPRASLQLIVLDNLSTLQLKNCYLFVTRFLRLFLYLNSPITNKKKKYH